MIETGAAASPANLGVSRETIAVLAQFAALVLAENQKQNLVAKSTEASIWNRHILDSAQLVGLERHRDRCWLDVGAGAGFPGMVLAILLRSEHLLVEPRRRRAGFLVEAADSLGLSKNVRVSQASVERIARAPVGTITARAVTTIDGLIAATSHLADEATTWLLHKGRNASGEVDRARMTWDARFEMLPSITDPDAAIVRVSDFAGRRRR